MDEHPVKRDPGDPEGPVSVPVPAGETGRGAAETETDSGGQSDGEWEAAVDQFLGRLFPGAG